MTRLSGVGPQTSRPDVVVVVAGTATDVGKTWIGCRLAEVARGAGLRVAARKPVQSFDPSSAAATDAHLLAAASGAEPGDVCPPHRWYERAFAPPMAAASLGRGGFTVDELLAELRWPAPADAPIDLGIVETAGALRSPIADDGDSLELARRVRPDLVLLVADAGLGTVGAVRAAMDVLGPARTAVLLNRFDAGDELHRRNLEWLADRDGYEVVTSIAEVWSMVERAWPVGELRTLVGPGISEPAIEPDD